jgi:hypothetical protein
MRSPWGACPSPVGPRVGHIYIARTTQNKKGPNIMHYMLVNITKKQYFRPIGLGAPHGRKYWGIASHYGPYDWQWLILLAHLVELQNADTDTCGHQKPNAVVGSWASDRILLLRGDDKSGRLMPEDLRVLKALGEDQLCDYKVLRDEYEDLTPQLKDWWAKKPWMMDSRFGQFTRPPDYGWLTVDQARSHLAYAASKGIEFARQYRCWLAKQPGLKPEIQDILHQELEKDLPSLVADRLQTQTQ